MLYPGGIVAPTQSPPMSSNRPVSRSVCVILPTAYGDGVNLCNG